MDEKEQKIENTENSKNTETKQKKRRGAPPEYWFKPGQSGNPAGRPKGSKNFITLFEKAVKEVAKKLELGEDPDAVEIQIIQRAIKEALAGKYPFYRDICDRVYGQPTKLIDITTQGEKINSFSEERIKEIAKLILEKENGRQDNLN
jgi:hypothetical protein